MIIKRIEDLKLVEEFIARSSHVAFDEETTGLNPRKNKVIGFGLHNGSESFYVAHLAWDGEKLVELIPKAACAALLSRLLSLKLITWNGSFDIRFAYHYFGVDLTDALWSEGMLAKHTINADGPFALKTSGAEVFGIDSGEEQRTLKEHLKSIGAGAKEFYKADLNIMAPYCVQDCKLTLELDAHYRQIIEDEGLTKFYFEDEVMPLYKEVTIPMEMKGVPVDVELLRRTDYSITNELKKLESEILETMAPKLGQFNKRYLNKMYPAKASGKFAQQLAKELRVELPLTKGGAFSLSKKAIEALPNWSLFRQFIEGRSQLPDHLAYKVQVELNGGEPELNLASKDQLRYVFFTIFKEKPTSFTNRGIPQVNEAFLSSVQDKYEFGPKLLEFNKLSKIKSSYIDRFLEEQEDGIFYPSFQQHRTTSGRYGGDLQQLPKALAEEDESSAIVRQYTNLVRKFFIAGPGYMLVDADYNSLEVVVFADDAGDESLLNMIRQDHDFYSTVAIDVHRLGDKYSADKSADNFLKKHQPKLRQDAKVYGLGIRYGMGDWKLSKTLNIDIEKAALIIEDYFQNFPKLKSKMDLYLKQAKTEGKVRSKAGRIRYLPEAKEIYEKWGDDILDMRFVYKNFPKEAHAELKKIRRRYNNLLNNALNFPIQSLAASIVNRASIKLARAMKERGLSAYICLNVHDEICARAPQSEVETIVPLMREIMENTTTLDAPLTAKPEVAYTYGDVK